MPGLSRKAAPLLRQVGNKAHATDADHETSHPAIFRRDSNSSLSSVPTEEDVTRSPEDSASEDDVLEVVDIATGSNDVVDLKDTNRVVTNAATLSESEDCAGSKRKQLHDQDDDIPSWMTNSQSGKRARSQYSSQQRSQTHTTFKKPANSAPPIIDSEEAHKAKATFKRARGATNPPSSPATEPKSSQNTFKRPSAALRLADTPHNGLRSGSSSPLSPGLPASSPPESDVEEVYLDGLDQKDLDHCPACGGQVSKSFKLDWELDHCAGKRMTIKKQEQFCQAHHVHAATETWDQRKYPHVDWTDLPRRLARHKGHIQLVISGQIDNGFRALFEERIKQAEAKTITKTWNAESDVRPRVGYYGSRGAKIMVDFVLKTFASKLRRLASTDKLLATASAAGGTTGYVHAVLVQELALALIMEDMDLTTDKAKAVLEESSELGEMLNVEEDEHLQTRATPPPATYGADMVDDRPRGSITRQS